MMRLCHFCIGSLSTQDLLVSRSFAPQGDPDQVRKVWAVFLDLLQHDRNWTSLSTKHASTLKQTTLNSKSRHSGTGSTARAMACPLYSKDACFLYTAINDLVLVACCPLPPTPTSATSSATRIPTALTDPSKHSGRQQTSGTNTPMMTTSTPSLSETPLIPALLGASETSHTESGATATSVTLQQPFPPRLAHLAFSTATALSFSFHSMVEFLEQLVGALERYLSNSVAVGDISSPSKSTAVSPPPKRTSLLSSSSSPAITSTNTSATSTAKPWTGLTANAIQSNIGIVYEILEECMELGYPMMPSYAQLDLFVFGVSKQS